MIGRALPAGVVILACVGAVAAGAESSEARWAAVVSCASRPDERQRHACIDDVLRQAGALDPEQDARDQRQRFGKEPATAPQAEPDTVAVKIRSVSETRDGRLAFTTEDGAVWRQIETKVFARTPQAGNTLTIHKGLIGNFLCDVDGRAAFRCARSR